MESPFYRKASDKIIAIEITLKRENGDDIFVSFLREDKIKDLIENEPFFRDLSNSSIG